MLIKEIAEKYHAVSFGSAEEFNLWCFLWKKKGFILLTSELSK